VLSTLVRARGSAGILEFRWVLQYLRNHGSNINRSSLRSSRQDGSASITVKVSISTGCHSLLDRRRELLIPGQNIARIPRSYRQETQTGILFPFTTIKAIFKNQVQNRISIKPDEAPYCPHISITYGLNPSLSKYSIPTTQCTIQPSSPCFLSSPVEPWLFPLLRIKLLWPRSPVSLLLQVWLLHLRLHRRSCPTMAPTPISSLRTLCPLSLDYLVVFWEGGLEAWRRDLTWVGIFFDYMTSVPGLLLSYTDHGSSIGQAKAQWFTMPHPTSQS